MTNITINRHLGDQNNNKLTLRQPFSSHTPMNRHLGKKYITINRHLGDQNNNKSTFMQHMTINRHLGYQNNNKSTFRRPK